MTIEALKASLSQERKLLEDILILNEELKNANTKEENHFFSTAIQSLINQVEAINNSIPSAITNINVEKVEFAPLPKQGIMNPIQRSGDFMVLSKENKKSLMQELKIETDTIKKIRKIKTKKQNEKPSFYRKPNNYAVVSSMLFSNTAYNFSKSEAYKKLHSSLKKANMFYLPSTYISMAILSTIILLGLSVIIALIASFFSITLEIGVLLPIFKPLGVDGLALRIAKNISLAFLAALITLAMFLFYPQSQASSISKKIEAEMPFAIIHMSSIAGSGVEPRKIFEILAASPEYPAFGNEVKKVINQVNLYGYDLVTALKNIAKSTSNEKLGGLFNGIATNVVSGGDLSSYLNKRASDTLLEYKLDRRKYSTIAETSMDIYLGILVAAPLILMVLLILMNVTGLGFGMSMAMTSLILIGSIALLNIGFLIFLQIEQPS